MKHEIDYKAEWEALKGYLNNNRAFWERMGYDAPSQVVSITKMELYTQILLHMCCIENPVDDDFVPEKYCY